MEGKVTSRAVAMLRGYARYLDEHAETVIGNIDSPEYVTEDGIRITFKLDLRSVPTVLVEHERIAMEALYALEQDEHETESGRNESRTSL